MAAITRTAGRFHCALHNSFPITVNLNDKTKSLGETKSKMTEMNKKILPLAHFWAVDEQLKMPIVRIKVPCRLSRFDGLQDGEDDGSSLPLF